MKNFVGFEEILVTDTKTKITFPMIVFYPTQTVETTIQIGQYTIEGSRSASVKQGKFPLVIISHGSGSSPILFRTHARFLAQNGFIVCLPEHPFNNRNNNEHADSIENLIDRPRHISESLDAILSNDKFKSYIEKEKISIIGHSIGGYTALALAGGVPHTKHQIEHDPNTQIAKSQEIPVTVDSRIKAIILLAPATGWFKSEGSLSEVKIPILIYSGDKDEITPLFHADIIKGNISNRNLITHKIIKNAGHFSFLSSFPAHMKLPNFPPANDPEGFNRENFHKQMYEEILHYLQQLSLAGSQIF